MSRRTVFLPAVGGEPTIAAVVALRDGWKGPEELCLIGSDLDPDKAALVALDRFFVAPRRDDPAYVDFLQKIIAREEVDIVWPNPTEEQEIWHTWGERLRRPGVRTILPPLQAVAIFSSKADTYRLAASLGLRTPNFVKVACWQELEQAARGFGYPYRPVIFRRIRGKGGIGLRVLRDPPFTARDLFELPPSGMDVSLDMLQGILQEGPWPECIVCEYLPGIEYDVDCFAHCGCVEVAIPRRNDRMWGGTSARSETVDRPDLVEISSTLLEAVGWEWIASVSWKEDIDGQPVLIEVNPRMPASINLAWKAGCNLPLAALQVALGRPLGPWPTPRVGVRLIRYFGEAYIYRCLGG
jgi:carbamoyl-phosphate synthase large subunit